MTSDELLNAFNFPRESLSIDLTLRQFATTLASYIGELNDADRDVMIRAGCLVARCIEVEKTLTAMQSKGYDVAD